MSAVVDSSMRGQVLVRGLLGVHLVGGMRAAMLEPKDVATDGALVVAIGEDKDEGA